MWTKLDKVLSDFGDYHIPVLSGIFLVGSVIDWFHRLDPTYVTFTGLVISAVTGHAIFSSKSADS